ncbi:CARDB domain-containing protein [Natrinema salaciae]|uniref:CARDB protein n=1 Tax=Natrinema salaciae TaxID=1186196 RepID=A0A1H9B7M6_9EURY|nr:CARDB domain-containing protein [Natrinema salaciae]SEP84258.1 CARDB protein [Natrinema salaciae]
MFRREDERAVTVQIGAVLLLAIVFTALALYQVNAVPAENGAVESEHNQQVRDEMQDLRNAIRNVGTSGGTESVAVTLGTQYPARTVSMNPPDPRGTLETTGNGTVRIDNASYVGSSDDYHGDPATMIEGDHATTTLVYEPDYNEYPNAPSTRIEHGYAFNDFEDATVPLTDQGLLNDGTIRLVLLEGALSESGSGAVSVDPTVLSGPSDAVPITAAEGAGNITITMPTHSPARWNETIGTTFDAGESDARVVAYADGELRIELADRAEEYALRMARVGIGDGGNRSDDYDVRRADDDSGDGGRSPAYHVDWQDPSGQSGVDDDRCDADSCTVVGDSVDLSMTTDETAADASVEYAVNDTAVGALSSTEGRTDSSGTHGITFDVSSDATDSDSVLVYTSSGSDGDRIRLDISRESSFDVTITGTNEPVGENETLSVTAEIENVGGAADTQAVNLTIGDGVGEVDTEPVELAPGESDTVTLDWETTVGDAGTYDATVASEDARETNTVDVGEHSPPTASIDAATYRTSGPWWWPSYDVIVDWSASDDDELSGGSVNEVRLYDSSGTYIGSREISPSGTTDSGRVQVSDVRSNPDGWTAELELSNTHDIQDTDSETVTAS